MNVLIDTNALISAALSMTGIKHPKILTPAQLVLKRISKVSLLKHVNF